MSASREALNNALGSDRQVVEALLAVRDLSSLGWRESLVGERVCVTDPQLLRYLVSQLHNPSEERLHVIYLDQDNRYIRDENIAVGTRDGLSMRIRSLIRRTLELEASKIIIAHNHPSGASRASTEDVRATSELEKIARALEIELVDHLIIARGTVYSMRADCELALGFATEACST